MKMKSITFKLRFALIALKLNNVVQRYALSLKLHASSLIT